MMNLRSLKQNVLALIMSVAIVLIVGVFSLPFIAKLLPVVTTERVKGTVTRVIYQTPYDMSAQTAIKKPKLQIALSPDKIIEIKGNIRIYRVGEVINVDKVTKQFGLVTYNMSELP